MMPLMQLQDVAEGSRLHAFSDRVEPGEIIHLVGQTGLARVRCWPEWPV